MVLNFLRRIVAETGPKTYFDFNSCFFLMISALLWGKYKTDPSNRLVGSFVRTIMDRQMSPFRENLNLNPLYSMRGGSTTRADPLTKKPKRVRRRSNPWYRWNTCNQRTLVLSAILSQESRKSIKDGFFSFLIKPSYQWM